MDEQPASIRTSTTANALDRMNPSPGCGVYLATDVRRVHAGHTPEAIRLQ
jgi:hypothetical protein